MLISPAYAQAATGAQSGAPAWFQFVPLVLMFGIMWFLLLRPQQKRAREHRELIMSVKRGEEVVTGGGLIGKVTRVTDEEVEVEIAKGVSVRVLKHTLSAVRGRTPPTPANDPKA